MRSRLWGYLGRLVRQGVFANFHDDPDAGAGVTIVLSGGADGIHLLDVHLGEGSSLNFHASWALLEDFLKPDIMEVPRLLAQGHLNTRPFKKWEYRGGPQVPADKCEYIWELCGKHILEMRLSEA